MKQLNSLLEQSVNHPFFTSVLLIMATIVLYQFFAYIQNRCQRIWLNPMILTILVIIPCLLLTGLKFEQYFQATQSLNALLEPAVVALGFPLYQHLTSIKYQWKLLGLLLMLGVFIVITISFTLTMILISLPEIAISLSLKSVTTPIGIALSEQLNGDNSITAFAIILAGLFGALLGPSWLKFINVHSAKAQGLAIGAASHAIGTASVGKISYEHGAYSSLALIVSAVLTALFSPILIKFLHLLFL